MSAFTADELLELGVAFHRGERLPCPRCEGRLAVNEGTEGVGQPQVDLLFICTPCGLDGEFVGPRSSRRWSPEEIEEIRSNLVRFEAASCPIDDALLHVTKGTNIGSRWFMALCPLCGEDWASE